MAVYVKQAFALDVSTNTIQNILPDTVERWGKFRVIGERSVVRSGWAAGRVSADRLRDSSYVRVST